MANLLNPPSNANSAIINHPLKQDQYPWKSIPFGYEMVTTSEEYRLYGDYSANLATLLNQCAGAWSPSLLAYQLPLGRASHIDVLLRKYQQEEAELDVLMEQVAGHIQTKKNNSTPSSILKHRQQAIASRRKVVTEQYQVGDRLHGKPIVDFGKRWQEYPTLLWQFSTKGVCSACATHKGLDKQVICQQCAAKQQAIQAVTYCYAYFE